MAKFEEIAMVISQKEIAKDITVALLNELHNRQ